MNSENQMMYKWNLLSSDKDFKNIPLNTQLYLLVENQYLNDPHNNSFENDPDIYRGYVIRTNRASKLSKYFYLYSFMVDFFEDKTYTLLSEDYNVVAYREIGFGENIL